MTVPTPTAADTVDDVTTVALPTAAVISHPFRLTPAGDVATIEAGSDDEAAEAIVHLLSTIGPDADEPGERDLVPGLGLADPTFGPAGGVFDVAGLNAQLALYGPADVTVADIVAGDLTADRSLPVTISFDHGTG